jgi:hypothetical protein
VIHRDEFVLADRFRADRAAAEHGLMGES